MSKVEKTIQAAQAWRQKHAQEALDFQALDQSLAAWTTAVQKADAAKEAAKAAKEGTIAVKKTVSAALKAAKELRKAKPDQAAVEA